MEKQLSNYRLIDYQDYLEEGGLIDEQGKLNEDNIMRDRWYSGQTVLLWEGCRFICYPQTNWEERYNVAGFIAALPELLDMPADKWYDYLETDKGLFMDLFCQYDKSFLERVQNELNNVDEEEEE